MAEEKKSTYRGYTQAQNKAHQTYKKKYLCTLALEIRKEEKERIKALAEKAGLPIVQFIRQAIDEKAARDNL